MSVTPNGNGEHEHFVDYDPLLHDDAKRVGAFSYRGPISVGVGYVYPNRDIVLRRVYTRKDLKKLASGEMRCAVLSRESAAQISAEIEKECKGSGGEERAFDNFQLRRLVKNRDEARQRVVDILKALHEAKVKKREAQTDLDRLCKLQGEARTKALFDLVDQRVKAALAACGPIAVAVLTLRVAVISAKKTLKLAQDDLDACLSSVL